MDPSWVWDDTPSIFHVARRMRLQMLRMQMPHVLGRGHLGWHQMAGDGRGWWREILELSKFYLWCTKDIFIEYILYIHIPRTQLTSLFGGLTFHFKGHIFQNISHLGSRYSYLYRWEKIHNSTDSTDVCQMETFDRNPHETLDRSILANFVWRKNPTSIVGAFLVGVDSLILKHFFVGKAGKLS